MSRILAIDYGARRTGIAVSDPLQIISTGLDTVDTRELIGFIKRYLLTELVTTFLVGYPLNMDGTPTHATPLVDKFLPKLRHVFPHIPVITWDERMTSQDASAALHMLGKSAEARIDKGMVDTMSAALILQDYLQSRPA